MARLSQDRLGQGSAATSAALKTGCWAAAGSVAGGANSGRD